MRKKDKGKGGDNIIWIRNFFSLIFLDLYDGKEEGYIVGFESMFCFLWSGICVLKESRVFRNILIDIRRDESVRIVVGGWIVGIF